LNASIFSGSHTRIVRHDLTDVLKNSLLPVIAVRVRVDERRDRPW
jgi:hypothetical protein